MARDNHTNQLKERRQILNDSITILPGEAMQIAQVLSAIESDMFSILVMVGNIKRIGKAGRYDDATVRFARRSHEMAGKLIMRFTGNQVAAIIAERKPDAKPRVTRIRPAVKTLAQKMAEEKKKICYEKQMKDQMFGMLNSQSLSPLEKLFFGNGLLKQEEISA
jgi:hypothetical protein